MTVGMFLRDKLFHLLSSAFAVLFAALLLSALAVSPGATAFLCLVLMLCALVPLGAEFAQKRGFYRDAVETLKNLEQKYLLSEFLEEPGFLEGNLFCQAMAEVSKAMNDSVSASKRDLGEYREYIETWVHEIKTPISSAQLLLENHRSPLTGALGEELFRIDRYVEQALFYARSGAVERDYLVKAVPLREVAAGAVKKYARPLIAAGFQIQLDGLDATVYSDPKWVEFILGQLISNAIKYCGEKPVLSFTQREDGASVTLLIADNGTGISQADLPRVFDKGFTGKNGREHASRATGLGLYLCRKLCDRLSLVLSLTSEEGKGTVVSIKFPKSKLFLLE